MVTFINGYPVVRKEKMIFKQKTRYHTKKDLDTKPDQVKDANPEHL